MKDIKIKSALLSVFSKEGLEPIAKKLNELGVQLLSTGGTYQYLADLDIPVQKVEDLTSYPSILDGRVKTLHPKVFGGILARREPGHQGQLENYDIPEIDLVIVDLYPFEQTVRDTKNEDEIIEKIDIGGISLIRAAAKNFQDVVVVPSQNEYQYLQQLLEKRHGVTSLEERKYLALKSFEVSSQYDTAIQSYFSGAQPQSQFVMNYTGEKQLRYGENPHQEGYFYGPLEDVFEQLNGKELSYNNLVDVDAAVQLMAEFKDDKPTFAVLKHTNACGVAQADSVLSAWQKALAGDPVSAFGGILISNTPIDKATAEEISNLFYEVLIAPDFDLEALKILKKKKKRILLRIKDFYRPAKLFKCLLNGVLVQDTDLKKETAQDLETVTEVAPNEKQIGDLLFANICAKHLKSNTIALVKNRQLIAMGCGQTSRVDALKQAIVKARAFGFDIEGAVMASDAFFPFPDCVEIADEAGVKAVIQPGGSIKDQDSIDYCNAHGMAMVLTGVRHFKH
ncbi:bifunctional phosphoribosylaminoimidazolecarboxamide formyltransferase/IMP cyclohydrolase [Membranicola marinus]|uniref:Bifunctional purine biosynthesis protein PurH n=1 Tax=Membranihabitans marinus TaxID=1227546 RepID=A0A953L711_9BACT|nr:bifunctional phosphoribosylaminoimidazolecarboxamide formyltransferase/IMP cyclohydrolase [Membranihabitans marinus]MBY5958242.1 bifunctional phosphoribosylaminoimidazolecarboxamide formyltransferase/IMP cyclohydrolase [Membranihabitans marinus]